MVKYEDFLKRYKNVNRIAGGETQQQLFKSIVFLVENEPQNRKTMNIIEKVLYNYVQFKSYAHKNFIGEVCYSLEIDLVNVPKNIAEAINKRAMELNTSIVSYEQMKRY